MITTTNHRPYKVYGWGNWHDKYDGRFCSYARPQGHVLIYMETFTRGRLAGTQHVDFELVHGGMTHWMTQRRTSRDSVTEVGALRIATRWAKEIADTLLALRQLEKTLEDN